MNDDSNYNQHAAYGCQHLLKSISLTSHTNHSLCLACVRVCVCVCISSLSEGLYLKRTALLSRHKTRTSYSCAHCRLLAVCDSLGFPLNSYFCFYIQTYKCCPIGCQKVVMFLCSFVVFRSASLTPCAQTAARPLRCLPSLPATAEAEIQSKSP